MTEEQLEEAFRIWRNDYPYSKLDFEVQPLVKFSARPLSGRSWLRDVRQALLMSTNELARCLDCDRTAIPHFEKRERAGTISLNNLEKMAAAMGCELVYGLRPKTEDCFSRIVWNEIVEEAQIHPWVLSREPVFKSRAAAAIARKYLANSSFRKSKRWSIHNGLCGKSAFERLPRELRVYDP